jgi:DNA topoisomerase-2
MMTEETKSTEETKLASQYQLKKQREHILDAPDTYVGGIEIDNIKDWIFTGEKMERKSFDFIPGLYKCFDEAIVNCRDHFIRQAQKKQEGEDVILVSNIEVNIDKNNGIITLINDGDGIDVAKHPEHNIYCPELIFANLMSSTNYDKNKKKITGGKNGFGVKLIFIYSEWGKVETIDHRRQLKYCQEYTDNLSKINPPKITKSGKKKPYTKVSFKLDFKRFGVDGISDDIFNILKKRTYDIAAVTDKTVKVKFNNELIPVRTFEDYINLYIGKKSDVNRVFEKQDRWEYGVCNTTTGEFNHISFVNGVYTAKGGKHVDYLISQIIRKISAYIEKKKKIKVTPASIKEQLMLFLNVSIENPAFDSQTKNYLNTPSSRFGSRCEISEKFIENCVKKLGVMEAAISLTQVKENKKSSAETDGSQVRTIRGIPKLIDANYAGTTKSKECTLILCEGDSAKAGIVSGLCKNDRNNFGVYPLKGKLLNASEMSAAKLNQNKEIADIKKILGLKSDFKYETIDSVHKELRYSKIMFMTDQDLDGSHIKGLCINLFHAQWPELMKIDSFLGFMNTPIIKVKRQQKEINFYTEQEYNTWKKDNNDGKGWSVKYFKGLGTSTAREFKDYFKDKKSIEFEYSGEECNNAIDLAFNKKRADDRKDWLCQYERDKIVDIKSGSISFKRFTDEEMIHFSKYDCERSIPNLMDGQKIASRKVLFSAFKRNLVKEVKVAQFSGYISEHSCYHHGEASLVGTIIGMAAEYVGNNNISLLVPKGQFGTRLRGGQDHASERYIFTHLNEITKFIYPESDNNVLEYKYDDGTKVEPWFYAPIIPMVCVNGGKGIGTGFSSEIPCFKVKDIINYILYKVGDGETKNDTIPPVRLHYQDFKGSIQEISKTKYMLKGNYEILSTDEIHVTELPVGLWTETFKEHLESLMDCKDTKTKKKVQGQIKSYKDMSTDTLVDFKIKFSTGVLSNLLTQKADDYQNKLEKLLKLTTTKSLTNMWLFDHKEKLKKYKSVYEIIEAYIPVRLEIYQKRIDYLIALLEKEVMILTNKARFIKEQCDDTIDLRKKKKEQVITILKERNYSILDNDEEFKYLRSMKIEDVEEENFNKLLKQCDEKMVELQLMKKETPNKLWEKELMVLSEKYKNYVITRGLRMGGSIKKKLKGKKKN